MEQWTFFNLNYFSGVLFLEKKIDGINAIKIVTEKTETIKTSFIFHQKTGSRKGSSSMPQRLSDRNYKALSQS